MTYPRSRDAFAIAGILVRAAGVCDQIGVMTAYGFMATVVILLMPLVTEFYELRKFMIERASVEPGSPVHQAAPQSPPPAADDTATATDDDDDSALKALKRTTNGRQTSPQHVQADVKVEDGTETQTDTV